MVISFENVFKDKILDTVRSFLNTEFAGTIPVYTGSFKNMGSQSIRLTPVGNDLVENLSTGEIREYIVDVAYYFKEKSVKRDTWEHILRQISRMENLFNDNLNNTYFNGRLVSMRINELEDEEAEIEGLNAIKWEFRAMFLSNVS
tara:strand:- start:42 stop:476 length:435 start_codon:yes stop_codon:yes gene_type:complete